MAEQWKINSPGKVVKNSFTTASGVTTAVVEYDEGTIITMKMTEDGNVDVHINKKYTADAATRTITIDKK